MVTVVVIGTLAAVGSVFWIGSFRLVCACPAESPLGAYYQLGPVKSDLDRGASTLATYQTTVSAGWNATAPSGWPVGPPLSTLGFHLASPNGTRLAISVVCALGANGTVLGTWSGSTGSWAGQASVSPAGCGATSAPSGDQPPGSSSLVAGTVLFYYLDHLAPVGTTFTVAVDVHTPESVWGGSISQTLSSGGVVWEASTPA
ncbi:MAG: hypothetical protein L3J87_05420 [Thermoplasmata archaeon]|nr:hypothetical protein [Thermoplasmata archaeon]